MPGPPQAHWRARSRSSVVLPHPRAGQHQRGIRQPIPVRQIRQHGRGRARHRAADAEVERRDVRHALDCAARSDRAPAHADAVPARQRDKPLPQLLLPGIERTFAHARKRFSTVLGARGRAAPGGIDQPLVSGKTQLQRLAGAHADLLQRRGGLDGRQHLHNPLRQIRLQIVLPRSLFHPRTRSFPGPPGIVRRSRRAGRLVPRQSHYMYAKRRIFHLFCRPKPAKMKPDRSRRPSHRTACTGGDHAHPLHGGNPSKRRPRPASCSRAPKKRSIRCSPPTRARYSSSTSTRPLARATRSTCSSAGGKNA